MQSFPKGGAQWHFFIGMLAWTVYCYATNLMIGWGSKVSPLILLPLCIGAGLIVLLLLTGNWTSFPKAVVSALGLGEIPVKMVVTKDGCDYLNKMVGDRRVCWTEPDDETAVVCPVMLRSRIGSPFVVGFSAYEDDGRWPQLHPPKRVDAIAIPKSDVPTWVQLPPAVATASAEKAAATALPGAVVTYMDRSDKGTWLREQCGAAPFVTPAVPTKATQSLAPAPS